MVDLVLRNTTKIAGVLSCFDRIVITGTIPGWCHAAGMTAYISSLGIRVFDYAKKFAEPLREEIRNNAENIAKQSGVTIEFIRKIKSFRKDERIKSIIAERGDHPGIVHIFSAMEACSSFVPWHDKTTSETALRNGTTKCLHYYFYFIDELFGLCYLRVPTYAPFRLQFYCNGHSLLANQLRAENIDFNPLENTFLHISNFERAQQLADEFPEIKLHHTLDALAQSFCPAINRLPGGYHWSIMQVEYATDIIFKQQKDLQPIYKNLVTKSIHTVQPEQVAMFLGKKLDGRTTAELGTKFNTRIMGTCIKHHMGWAAIKMYDKHGIVLRIETTVNNVSELKHYRAVEHKDGTTVKKFAPMQKTIYSLPALRELLVASNRRYLDFLSDLDDTSEGEQLLPKLGTAKKKDGRSWRGFNLFSQADLEQIIALLRGEHCISGVTNRMMRCALPGKSSSQISYFFKRCRVFGLLKKQGKKYKYYLTKSGRRTLLTARKLQEFLVIPMLAGKECA